MLATLWYESFGNDEGVLMVVMDPTKQAQIAVEGPNTWTSEDSSFEIEPAHVLILALTVGIIIFQLRRDTDMVVKLGVLLLLVIAIIVMPSVSDMWSKEVDNLGMRTSRRPKFNIGLTYS